MCSRRISRSLFICSTRLTLFSIWENFNNILFLILTHSNLFCSTNTNMNPNSEFILGKLIIVFVKLYVFNWLQTISFSQPFRKFHFPPNDADMYEHFVPYNAIHYIFRLTLYEIWMLFEKCWCGHYNTIRKVKRLVSCQRVLKSQRSISFYIN